MHTQVNHSLIIGRPSPSHSSEGQIVVSILVPFPGPQETPSMYWVSENEILSITVQLSINHIRKLEIFNRALITHVFFLKLHRKYT